MPAICGISRDVVGDIELTLDHCELVGRAPVRPRHTVVRSGPRRRGNGNAGRDRDKSQWAGQVIGLIADVGGEAQPLAAIIQVEHGIAELVLLPIDGRAAVGVAAVEPNAELLVVAKAPRDIDLRAEHRFRLVGRRQLRDRKVGSLLGDQVDASADRAGGRHPVQQGARAFQDFDAFSEIGGHGIVRRQAIEAVQRNIAVAVEETADEVDVLAEAAAGTRYKPH